MVGERGSGGVDKAPPVAARLESEAQDPEGPETTTWVGCPIEGCGRWFLSPWDLEGHTASAHPGWTAIYELLRPYSNQRQRVVYHRTPPAT